MKRKPQPQQRNIDGIIRPQTTAKNQWWRAQWRVIVVSSLLVIAVAIIGWTHFHKPPAENFDDLVSVKAAVGRHYLLPGNEEPALATITDSRKVTSAFQGKAENGDRVLIYQKNSQAIVYRPAIDKVVAVVPVSIDTPKGGKTIQ